MVDSGKGVYRGHAIASSQCNVSRIAGLRLWRFELPRLGFRVCRLEVGSELAETTSWFCAFDLCL